MARSYGAVAASVAREKEQHPGRFCGFRRCLWRIQTRNGFNPCRKHMPLLAEIEQATRRELAGWQGSDDALDTMEGLNDA